MSVENPSYVAHCPECGAMVCATVITLDEPKRMKAALKARAEWVKWGLVVSVGSTEDVRTAPQFGHTDACSMKR